MKWDSLTCCRSKHFCFYQKACMNFWARTSNNGQTWINWMCEENFGEMAPKNAYCIWSETLSGLSMHIFKAWIVSILQKYAFNVILCPWQMYWGRMCNPSIRREQTHRGSGGSQLTRGRCWQEDGVNAFHKGQPTVYLRLSNAKDVWIFKKIVQMSH